MPAKLLAFVFLLMGCLPATAQVIKGEVLDMETKHPLEGVSIENVHTALGITTDSKGSFLMAATGDQLLVFQKPGYKTVRVRVPMGYVPPFFRIIMVHGMPEVKDEYLTNRYDYHDDSIRFHELYKHELEFPKLSTIDMIAHPFSAMSGRNRDMWHFQEEFDYFEKEKYVDMTFNEKLVTRMTGLKGDSLRYYMRRYRPTYEQLRSMNDYTFFNYIKSTLHYYRQPNIPRNAQ